MAGFGWLKTKVVDLADSLIRRKQRSAAKAFLMGLRKDVRRAFAESIDPVTGSQWAPVQRQGKPLIVTGTLMRAAIAAADAAKESGGGVVVQLSEPHYGKYHQHGTRRIKRRRFFGVSPETAAAARKSYAQDMVQLIVGK